MRFHDRNDVHDFNICIFDKPPVSSWHIMRSISQIMRTHLWPYGHCYITINNCSGRFWSESINFFYAPLPLFARIKLLFNGMLLHGFVPCQFQLGTVVPIVKDRQGDKGDLNNYRGITIAPNFSKIFEHALRIIFQPFLSTSSYQFGFKKKSSTSLAIHCLKETINYYV